MTTPFPPRPELPKLDDDTIKILLWVAFAIEALLLCGGAPGMVLAMLGNAAATFWWCSARAPGSALDKVTAGLLPLPLRFSLGLCVFYLILLLGGLLV